MKSISVYGLYSTEQGTSVVRYVGQTKYPLNQRRNAHVKRSLGKAAITHLHRWVRDVYSRGFEVKAILLKSGAHWNSDEIEFIRKFRAMGMALTNSTDGGEGCLNPCPEMRSKISGSLKGKPLPLKTRQKMSEAHKGKARSRAICRKISKGLKGNKNALGRVCSQETIRKLSEAHKRENLSAETRRKNSESHRRENLSAETLRKRSEGSKAMWKRKKGRDSDGRP